MVPPRRRRRKWPLQLAAVFATAGVVALGFQAWVEDRRSAHLAAEIRTLRAPRADDNWTWCTSTIAAARGSSDGAAGADVAGAFRQRYEQGFRAFEVALDSTLDASVVIEFASAHRTVHWLLDLRGDERATLDAFVAAARRRDAAILDRMHPEMRQPENLAYALRLYPFPSVVYAPTDRRLQTPAMAIFVRDAAAGVVVLPREHFSREVASALAAVGARAYVSGVNDSAEAQRFHDWGAVGVVTDSLPPYVTCHQMSDG